MSDINQDKELSLKDILVETMRATLEADADVARRYYQTLEEYAFEGARMKEDKSDNAVEGGESKKSKKLKMAHFEVPNADGVMQEISIPQLALMPLPILQVSEATFDLNLNMQEASSNDQVSMSEEKENAIKPPIHRPGMNNLKLKRKSKFIINLPQRVNPNSLGMSAPTIGSEGDKNENQQNNSTFNLKVNVKMTQSDMPTAVTTLLQTVAKGMQIKLKKE